MDHQSVGLIARKIEAAGIPTVYLGSCRDMMAKVKAPRSVFLNFPLGRQCGKPHDRALQTNILKEALNTLTTAATPGRIVDLSYQWDKPFDWADYSNDIQAMLEEEDLPAQDWNPNP
ncbi:MAG: hypothetical protein GY866_03690 [Proteobacteria bacterium]|nr:hypothetical protein [Pseudomonadota bacterium]